MVSGTLARPGNRSARLLTLGLALAFACHAALVALALAGACPLSVTLPLLILCMVAIGYVMPNAVHGALEPFPDVAGTASALRGCLQMVGGAVASALVAELYRGTLVAMALVITLCSAAALAVWVAVLRPVTRAQPAGHA